MFEEDEDGADLAPNAKQHLSELVAVLASVQERDFQVAGHSDNVERKRRKFPSNLHFSTARAVTVATFLAEHGIPASRLSAAGYAGSQPAFDNGTPEGRLANRRTEIVLMPTAAELPDLSQLEALTRKPWDK